MLPHTILTYITPASLKVIGGDVELAKRVNELNGTRTTVLVPTQSDVGVAWKNAQDETKKILKEIDPKTRMAAIAQVRDLGVKGLHQNQITEAILAGAQTIVTEEPIVPSSLKSVLNEVRAHGLPALFPKVTPGYTID